MVVSAILDGFILDIYGSLHCCSSGYLDVCSGIVRFTFIWNGDIDEQVLFIIRRNRKPTVWKAKLPVRIIFIRKCINYAFDIESIPWPISRPLKNQMS